MLSFRIKIAQELKEYIFAINSSHSIGTMLFELVIWIKIMAKLNKPPKKTFISQLRDKFLFFAKLYEHVIEIGTGKETLQNTVHETTIGLICETLIGLSEI